MSTRPGEHDLVSILLGEGDRACLRCDDCSLSYAFCSFEDGNVLTLPGDGGLVANLSWDIGERVGDAYKLRSETVPEVTLENDAPEPSEVLAEVSLVGNDELYGILSSCCL